MSEPLRQILYVSVARANNEVGVVDTILAQSRANNARDHLTGLLYTDGGRYMQALEGDGVAVERTFARISADPRHHQIVVLSDREVPAREFGGWSMAYHRDTNDRGAFDHAMRAALLTAAPLVRKRFLDLLDD